jgi:hypothetical protein
LVDFPKGHVPSRTITLYHPSFGPIFPGISDIFTPNTGFWIATIGIIHLSIGVMADNMGIRNANHEHPMTSACGGVSRTLMKDSTAHRVTLFQLLFKGGMGAIPKKVSFYPVMGTGSDVCDWIGGISILKNGTEIVIISIRPQKGSWLEIFHRHGTRTREAHAVPVTGSGVQLGVVLIYLKRDVSHGLLEDGIFDLLNLVVFRTERLQGINSIEEKLNDAILLKFAGPNNLGTNKQGKEGQSFVGNLETKNSKHWY